MMNRLFLALLAVIACSPAILFAGSVDDATLDRARAANATVTLGPAFAAAAAEFDVPEALLLAVGYVETRWRHNGGLPSIDQGYGVMHLVDNDYARTLPEAAALLGLSREALIGDPAANIRGAAVLLRQHAGPDAGTRPEDYIDALLHLAALHDERTGLDQVTVYLDTLRKGATAVLPSGETLTLKAQAIGDPAALSPRLRQVAVLSDDYGPALWDPAAAGNFGVGRGGNTIQYWVNHWIGVGTYAGAISWFKNPSSGVSAHFVCRVTDGQLTQMVRLADTGYHAGNFSYNQRSIGIEHDAAVGRESDWNSVPMLTASTTVCRTMCDRYGIPKTRTYILGHKEVPGSSTACPGPLPWDTYMSMLTQQPPPTATPTPTATPPAGGVPDILIECRTGGQNLAWYSESGVWADNGLTCSAPGCTAGIGSRYASTYRSLAGLKRGTFTPDIVYAGPYEVYVAWANGASRRTPILYRIVHQGGTTELELDQTQAANVWYSLGTYTFAGGTNGSVTVSNERIDESGSMYASALKFVHRGGAPATSTPTNTLAPTNTPTATWTNTPLPTATPTHTPPPAPDTDGDGVPDTLESLNPGAGRTHLLLADSDGDGLADGVEDANRNGQRDAGETDARNRDSDGDGLMDGVEGALFSPSNPLHAGSPGAYTDADADGLPTPEDFNDTLPDLDGDRFSDGYEFAYLGLNGTVEAGQRPGLGDVNRDGAVTNVDALVVQSLFLGLVTPGSAVFGDKGFVRSDPNRDGQITNVDALVLQAFFLGTVPRLPL